MAPFPFGNIEFFVVAVPALLLVLASKRLGDAAWSWTLVAVSAALFAWLPGLRYAYAALCAALIAVTFAGARLRAHGGGTTMWRVAIAALVIVFAAIRVDAVGWLGEQPQYGSRLLPLFGFSFFVVKAYGLLIDVAAGRVKTLRASHVLAYFLFFPTIIAGPIFRFGDFSTQLQAAAAQRGDWQRIASHLPRLMFGAFKAMVLAALIEPWSIHSLSADVIATDGRRVYAGMLAYYFFEYVNFSGYSDMAIAVSGMAGLTAPENFNLPFLARSLTELWRRWHISFASWLRDYVYFPLNFQLAARLRPSSKRARSAIAGLAIFLTFLFCGFWHGLAPGTMLFGALSGVVLGVEAFAAGLATPNRNSAAAGVPPSLRLISETTRQIWTLHVAALTFAPVLLTTAQLAAFARLFTTLL